MSMIQRNRLLLGLKNYSRFRVHYMCQALGMRYYVKEKDEGIKAYVMGGISRPFFTISSTNRWIEGDLSRKGLVSAWFGNLGFGSEYYIGERFAVGGEFGFQFYYAKTMETYEVSVFNPDTNQNEVHEDTFVNKFMLNPTYAKFVFTFFLN